MKWLSPASIKKDTERLLALADEFSCTYDLKEIKKNQKTIRERKKERNLRNSVLDHLDDMVWAKDLDGKYLMTNKSFRKCSILEW